MERPLAHDAEVVRNNWVDEFQDFRDSGAAPELVVHSLTVTPHFDWHKAMMWPS